MATTGNLISAPVSIKDVQQTFGRSETDLGTLIKNLVDNDIVNKWSKYKPIRYATVGLMTDAMFSQNQGTGNYTITWGIKRKVSYDYSDLEIDGVIQSGLWEYDKPVGGANSPWRLADFNGYAHNAVAPIELHLDQSETIGIPTTYSGDGTTYGFLFTFGVGVQGWSASTCLALNEYMPSTERGYYPTVQMICVTGSGTSKRVWRYAKSGDKTVQECIDSGNPVCLVTVNTAHMLNAIGNGACMNAGSVWTACMILTPTKYTGYRANYQLNSGAISRLEYNTGVDRKSYTVVRTSWQDELKELSFTVYMKARSGYTTQFYVEKIVVSGKHTVGTQMYLTMTVTYTAVGGTVSGNSTFNETFVLEAGTATKTQTYQGTEVYNPNFDFSGSQIPSGVKPAGISITFAKGNEGSVTGSVTIRCETSTLTATSTIK